MIRSIFENFDLKIGLLHYSMPSVEISLFCASGRSKVTGKLVNSTHGSLTISMIGKSFCHFYTPPHKKWQGLV